MHLRIHTYMQEINYRRAMEQGQTSGVSYSVCHCLTHVGERWVAGGWVGQVMTQQQGGLNQVDQHVLS